MLYLLFFFMLSSSEWWSRSFQIILLQEVAKKVGEIIAKSCLEKGITKVAFDRGGYPYHGRVQALADAARENGLDF